MTEPSVWPQVWNYLPMDLEQQQDLSYSRFRHFYLVSGSKTQCESPSIL